MNVKYANKVVVVKNFEVPAGEFNHQVKPIEFKAGQVLWKYNGKYNKRPAELSAKGFEWGASWCEAGYVIPAEFVEFVSEQA